MGPSDFKNILANPANTFQRHPDQKPWLFLRKLIQSLLSIASFIKMISGTPPTKIVIFLEKIEFFQSPSKLIFDLKQKIRSS